MSSVTSVLKADRRRRTTPSTPRVCTWARELHDHVAYSFATITCKPRGRNVAARPP